MAPVTTSARIADYLAGGSNWTVPDRAAGEAVTAILGKDQIERMARTNRLFAARVAAWSMERVTQIVDLGCGFIPGGLSAGHARSVRPGAGVAYVDFDDEVCDQLEAVLYGDMGAAAVRADIRDPAGVMSHPDLLKVIVPDRPALFLAAAVLHYLPPAEAARVAARYMELAAPGSLLAVSCLRVDDRELWARMRAAYPAASCWNFTRRQFAGLFAGLDVVPPGIAPAASIRPGWQERLRPPGPAYVVGGIGRKPPR